MSSEDIDVNSPEFAAREAEVAVANEEVCEFMEAVRVAHLENRTKFLGKVLTIVDATYEGEARVKAVKDLVHDAFKSFDKLEARISGDEFNRLTEVLVPEEDRITMGDPFEDENQLPSLEKKVKGKRK